MPALSLNKRKVLSNLLDKYRDLTIQHLIMSPFTLYLYLKPLYSSRGGSTILEEPFIKNPSVVLFLKKPLYRWNIFDHLTLVLSVT